MDHFFAVSEVDDFFCAATSTLGTRSLMFPLDRTRISRRGAQAATTNRHNVERWSLIRRLAASRLLGVLPFGADGRGEKRRVSEEKPGKERRQSRNSQSTYPLPTRTDSLIIRTSPPTHRCGTSYNTHAQEAAKNTRRIMPPWVPSAS